MPKGKAFRAQEQLRSLLSGGDRRSIAQSARVLKLVREDPASISQLAQLACDEEWLVSMRAMDLLEKLAHENAEWVEPHRHLFIGPLADSPQWEIRLQVVRALPLFSWSPAEQRRAVEILLRDAEHPQKFVRSWAVNSLASFAENDATLLPLVRRFLSRMERSGSKALMSRARQIRERMETKLAAVTNSRQKA